MPVLPRHPNCKCHYEDVYEENTKETVSERKKFENMIYGNIYRFLYAKKDMKQKAGNLIEEIKSLIQKKDLTLYDWEQIIEKSKKMDVTAQNTKKELLSITEELKKIGLLIASKYKSHSETITDFLAHFYMQQVGILEFILT